MVWGSPPAWEARRDVCAGGGAKLTCQPHGESSQKQALAWVVEHGGPYLGVQEVTGGGDGGKDEEEADVEGEEDAGEVGEPGRGVG